jgi:hypothetical protein
MCIIEIIVMLIWYGIGFSGYYFWWTREFGYFNRINVLQALWVGFCGPLTWGIGWVIHGEFWRN